MTQFGNTIRNPIGSNLESTFSREQEVRARIEEIQEYQRVSNVLQQHLDGKISALSISYMDIVKDPTVLDNVTPISREADVDGKIILWEGYVKEKPDFFSGKPSGNRGPLHRVVQHADGRRVYCRYSSTAGQWLVCNAKENGVTIANRFPKPVYRYPKSELWASDGGDVVARTVMKADGTTEQRVYQTNFKQTPVRR